MTPLSSRLRLIPTGLLLLIYSSLSSISQTNVLSSCLPFHHVDSNSLFVLFYGLLTFSSAPCFVVFHSQIFTFSIQSASLIHPFPSTAGW